MNKDQLVSENYNDLNRIFELQDIFEDLYQSNEKELHNNLYKNSCKEELYNNPYEDSCEKELHNDLYEDSCKKESHYDWYEKSCEEELFNINALYRKSENLVFINKFANEHNHDLQNQDSLQEFSPALHKIPDYKIQFYIQEYQLGATQNIQVKNDAIALLEHLIQLHSKDPKYYFKVDFE
ncbi:27025_t:CDS:2, partial [Gigaspora margarita]